MEQSIVSGTFSPVSATSSDRTRVALCNVDSLPAGQGRCFSVAQLKIAVFRQRDGSIFAVDAACPHSGGPLADGIVGGGIVVCPLHSHRFRLSDGSGVDNEYKVRTYAVEMVDGRVYLTLPAAE